MAIRTRSETSPDETSLRGIEAPSATAAPGRIGALERQASAEYPPGYGEDYYHQAHVYPDRTERVLGSVGIIDQAVLSLLQFRQISPIPYTSRSYILDVIRTYGQFRSNTRFISQAKLLLGAGGVAFALIREWRDVFSHRGSRDAYHFYRMASLATATALVPWMLLRRR